VKPIWTFVYSYFSTNPVPFAEPVVADPPRSGDNAAATKERRNPATTSSFKMGEKKEKLVSFQPPDKFASIERHFGRTLGAETGIKAAPFVARGTSIPRT
jgi:hypothetical protein